MTVLPPSEGRETDKLIRVRPEVFEAYIHRRRASLFIFYFEYLENFGRVSAQACCVRAFARTHARTQSPWDLRKTRPQEIGLVKRLKREIALTLIHKTQERERRVKTRPTPATVRRNA